MESILATTLSVLLVLLSVASIGLTVVGMPGNFVIVVLTILYCLVGRFAHFPWWWILVLLGIAILGEILEFLLGTFTNVRFGASKWGVLGAFIGGLSGSIAGTAALPVIGTILGAIIGAFSLSFLFEHMHRSDVRKSLKAGYGASLGIILARSVKILLGIGMIVILVILLF